MTAAPQLPSRVGGDTESGNEDRAGCVEAAGEYLPQHLGSRTEARRAPPSDGPAAGPAPSGPFRCCVRVPGLRRGDRTDMRSVAREARPAEVHPLALPGDLCPPGGSQQGQT